MSGGRPREDIFRWVDKEPEAKERKAKGEVIKEVLDEQVEVSIAKQNDVDESFKSDDWRTRYNAYIRVSSEGARLVLFDRVRTRWNKEKQDKQGKALPVRFTSEERKKLKHLKKQGAYGAKSEADVLRGLLDDGYSLASEQSELFKSIRADEKRQHEKIRNRDLERRGDKLRRLENRAEKYETKASKLEEKLAEARLIEQRLQAELMGAIAKSQMLEALVTGSEKDILERQAEIKGDSVGPSVKKEFKLSLERAMKGVSSQVVVKDSGRNEPSASDESDEKPNQSITGDIHKLLEYKGEE